MLAISSKINMVSPELEQAATAAVLLSMIAAPFILGSSDTIVSRFVKSDWDMKALDLHSMLVETMSKSEHVLIIGAGIAGAATARKLAEHGVRVTVLEAGKAAQAGSGNRQAALRQKSRHTIPNKPSCC